MSTPPTPPPRARFPTKLYRFRHRRMPIGCRGQQQCGNGVFSAEMGGVCHCGLDHVCTGEACLRATTSVAYTEVSQGGGGDVIGMTHCGYVERILRGGVPCTHGGLNKRSTSKYFISVLLLFPV